MLNVNGREMVLPKFNHVLFPNRPTVVFLMYVTLKQFGRTLVAL